MSTERIANDEKQRLTALLFSCNVRAEKIAALESVIENVAWMKARLDEARNAITGTTVAIPYDNGGGQKGIRENPAFKGYEALFKSYMGGMDRILACLPEEAAQEAVDVDKPKTVLQLVRDKHRTA